MDINEGKPEIHAGLEGIYFTESSVCKVDGQQGRLYYRGYPIETLANSSNFTEVAYLLLYGKLPTGQELDAFDAQMREERSLPGEVIAEIGRTAARAHPMDTMRTAISMLSAYDAEAYNDSPDANMRKSIRLISKSASIAATIGRYRSGKLYVAPDASLSHAENFLYMLSGEKPDKVDARILDVMFTVHAEHSSNASTFGVLVAGSTLADLYSSVTAGMAVLKGPLHGGADEAALRMMREIGSADNTERYIDDALAGKKKIMGFGHRVYKTYDPRARIVRSYLESLLSSPYEEQRNLAQIALSAEKLMIDRLGKAKGIWPNIDFFAGPVYVSLGIPAEVFTPIFAAARMAGWCAHMLEYWKSNKLLRPLEYYSGQLDLDYVPVEKR